MTKTSDNSRMPIHDVLYALSLEERQLNADVLEEYVRDFKKYAGPLTDFAIELVIDRIKEGCEAPERVGAPSRTVSPAVSRAISRFHNKLHQLGEPIPIAVERATQPGSP